MSLADIGWVAWGAREQVGVEWIVECCGDLWDHRKRASALAASAFSSDRSERRGHDRIALGMILAESSSFIVPKTSKP